MRVAQFKGKRFWEGGGGITKEDSVWVIEGGASMGVGCFGSYLGITFGAGFISCSLKISLDGLRLRSSYLTTLTSKALPFEVRAMEELLDSTLLAQNWEDDFSEYSSSSLLFGVMADGLAAYSALTFCLLLVICSLNVQIYLGCFYSLALLERYEVLDELGFSYFLRLNLDKLAAMQSFLYLDLELLVYLGCQGWLFWVLLLRTELVSFDDCDLFFYSFDCASISLFFELTVSRSDVLYSQFLLFLNRSVGELALSWFGLMYFRGF